MLRLAGVSAAAATLAAATLEMTLAQTTCSAPPKTLTFDCDGACGDNTSPCWRNSTASCSFECYSIYADSASTSFVLLVPFSPSDNAAFAASDAKSADLRTYISKSDDLLDAIDTLDLPTATTKVSVMGGSYFKTNFVKGRAANVKLASDWIAQTRVREVYLASLDLGSSLKQMTTMLPPATRSITLNNALLKTFPADFAKFTALQELSLSNNYISAVAASTAIDTISQLVADNNNITSFSAVFKNATAVTLSVNELHEFPAVFAQYFRLETLQLDHNNISEVNASHVVESLKSLRLDSNRITKFDAVFPSLMTLDLSSNNLTKIPSAVFDHPKLTELDISGNQLENITLTNRQAVFLNKLIGFSFSGTIFVDCFVYEQKVVQGITFCINDVSSESADSGGGGGSTKIIIGVAAGVLVALCAGIFFWLRPRKTKSRSASRGGRPQSRSNTEGTGAMALWKNSGLLSVKVDADDIEDLKLLGKGAFGEVWLVQYRKTQTLASKRLRKSSASQDRTNKFIEEIKLVAKLEHPKIVRFIGAAWTIQADLQALFEYMEGGDLRAFLEDPSTAKIWSSRKLQIAIDVAEALVYVHSFSPPLLHRDLKSRNVLLSGNLGAKLTDFGTARVQSENDTMTSGVGTGKWIAPEVISGESDYGPAADVFSFGAVLSELDSHKLPYDEARGPAGNQLAEVALLQKVALGQVTPSFSASCPAGIAALGRRCFARDPTERPNAVDIAFALREARKDTA